MSKRKYRGPRTYEKGQSFPPAPKLPHKPMSDAGLLTHLNVIKVIAAFPDTVMTAGQIKDFVVLDGGEVIRNSVNQSLHHLCKLSVRENGEPASGHRSRLDDYEEFHDVLGMGVLYRTTTGTFVLDTEASWQGEWHRNARGIQVRRLRLVGNRWPHLPYKGETRVIPANKAKAPDVPPAEKVVESVLDEIDNPKPVAEMTVEEYVGPDDVFVPTPEADKAELAAYHDEPVKVGTNGSNPESVKDSGFELLSMPTKIITGSEMVLRVDNEIVIATVLKRYPLAGRS